VLDAHVGGEDVVDGCILASMRPLTGLLDALLLCVERSGKIVLVSGDEEVGLRKNVDKRFVAVEFVLIVRKDMQCGRCGRSHWLERK
jgi:hypothetical protein